MLTLFKNLRIVDKNSSLVKKEILIEDEYIKNIADNIKINGDYKTIDLNNNVVLPGLIDAHVHLRDPGLEYKETVETGSLAAARGGFTTIFPMSNVIPFPDEVESIKKYQAYLNKKGKVKLHPYACLTYKQAGETVVDIPNIKKLGIDIFTDDGGYGPRTLPVIKKAMELSNKEDVILAFHCEDRNLESSKRTMLTCLQAEKLGIHGGMSNLAEAIEVARYIKYAKQYKAHIHICHVSCKQSIDLIKQAIKEGVDISSEATCHHLTLVCDDVINANFKMTPPLKTKEDRLALIEAINDGTITMIASDHAPHSLQDKSKGLVESAFGITSLETSFPVLYTDLVKSNLVSLNRLIELMTICPAKRFKLDKQGELKIGNYADFTVVNLDKQYKIDSSKFVSKGKNTPYENKLVYGKILQTYVNGNLIYKEEIDD